MEETLGKRIVFHRKRLGLTQDALAELMGVTAQAVSKWENDQSCPDIGALPKLAEIFGISTDELLGVERKEVHPAEIVPADGEENDVHPEMTWELSMDDGKKGGIGLAIWILLVGGIMLTSYLLNFHAKLWDVVWPSALLVFGIFGLFPRFSFFRLGCSLFGLYFLMSNLNFAPFRLGREFLLPVLLLLFGGMPMFDAICVSLGTAGTGGFGNWNNSIAHYNSAYLQNVISVFMILFGINFNAYFLLLTRKFKQLFKIEEIRVYLGVIAVFTTLIAFNVRGCFGSLRESFHHSLFQVASIITTTGFSTVDFNQWPAFSKLLLVLLMFIGACAGSTGGGMKCSRILLLFKGVKKEMMSLIHPRLVRVHKMDGQRVQHEVMRSVNAFLVAYLIVIATSILIVSLHCEDMVTSFTSVVTCINNVGPGLNQVGPAANFGALHPLSKIVLTFDMLAGRLELFPMLLLFAPETWRRNR